jgi:uncharacterized protein (TIGR02118 family)
LPWRQVATLRNSLAKEVNPRLLGAACLYYMVDKGISGRGLGTDPVYAAKCEFVCTSVEAYRAASGQHQQEIRGDIANYTDIQPMVKINEVVVERSEV